MPPLLYYHLFRAQRRQGAPMINLRGDDVVKDSRDGWTIRTATGTPSAHFENTVAITGGAAWMASSRHFWVTSSSSRHRSLVAPAATVKALSP